MKTLKLSLTKEINLRSIGHIQHSTTESFDNGEKVLVDMVGVCKVKCSIIGLIELKVIERLWIRDKKEELVKIR